MRIAVIGAGIAGNIVAYHLGLEHDVTVFEAADHIGGHTHTHNIEWRGRQFSIDTGFMAISESPEAYVAPKAHIHSAGVSRVSVQIYNEI